MQGRGLAKRYGERVVLDRVHLALTPGRCALVEGRSGSGKSTLLAVLAGLDAPDAGQVLLDNVSLYEMGEDERAAVRLRRFGFVFQDHRLLPDLTAAENVALPLQLAGRRDGARRALDLLGRVGLGDRGRAYPDELSGGEGQRVAIARAVANEPAVIFADEPTASLDEASARAVLALLAGLAREGRAVLVAAHDPLARGIAHEAWSIAEGKLLPRAPPAASGRVG